MKEYYDLIDILKEQIKNEYVLKKNATNALESLNCIVNKSLLVR